MIRFKIFSTVAFLFCISLCEAQFNVQVTMGEEYKAPRRSTLSGVIGHDETGIYTLSVRGLFSNVLTIEHFDKQLKRTKFQEIELIKDKKERNFEFIIHSSGKLYLFSSFYDQKLKKTTLFSQTVSKETLALNNDLKNVAEITSESRHNSGGFNYRISKDKSKIMIFYNLPYEKTEPEKFGFHVYDVDLNELWTKSISLPYSDGLFTISTYKVSDKGNVFLLGKIYEEKSKDVRFGKVNFKYTILSYSNSENTVKEYGVSLGEKFLTDMQIAITPNEDIVCAGFYSDKGMHSIKGTYFLRVDGATKEIVSKSTKEFGLNFITLEMTEKQAAKTKRRAEKGKDTELYEYDLDNLILRDDGGAVLVGEQYYVRVTTSTYTTANGGMSTVTTYHYYYNDVIVINIDPSGNIQWAVKVAKDQHTINDGGFFSSYALHVNKDNIYIIFNDNPKNMSANLAPGKRYNFVPYKESEVVIAQIDHHGNITKKSLFSSLKKDIITRPKVCKQISEKEMVIFGQKKTTQRFSMLVFE
ncbi:MAG TPA: hypothetical protein VNW99_05765 [Cytophagaceae bacterium]|nr:hypothetical protein [Cytophagaceae bacterium]